MIRALNGTDLGVVRNENHAVCEWKGDGRVVFSFCCHGNAISAHFAAEKAALRKLSVAIESFCDWIFNHFRWCELIMANVERRSVKKLIERCGFEFLKEGSESSVYMRNR